MFGMNGTVARERLYGSPESYAETDRIGCIADPDLLGQSRRQIEKAHGPFEHQIH
jgi:hypothetical protein